jgi:hypothetical protein
MSLVYVINTVNYFIEAFLPQTLCYVSLMVYTRYLDIPLLSENTILITSYYITMSQTFGFEFMEALRQVINANVSIGRIKVNINQIILKDLFNSE